MGQRAEAAVVRKHYLSTAEPCGPIPRSIKQDRKPATRKKPKRPTSLDLYSLLKGD